MFSKPVFELVLTLGDVSRYGETGGDDEQCRGSGCILRAARLRVGSRREGHFHQLDRALIPETF